MMPVPTELARLLSPADFAQFGLGEIAYVRPVQVNGAIAYSVVGADGTVLTALPSRAAAHGTIIQNDMDALSLH